MGGLEGLAWAFLWGLGVVAVLAIVFSIAGGGWVALGPIYIGCLLLGGARGARTALVEEAD